MAEIIHVLRPSGHYEYALRPRGCRNYEFCKRRFKSAERAMAAAARNMRGYHRFVVFFVDHSPYYEPHVVLEGKRA